jgi:branched-chain amino acid transport system substrate-binding protein
LLVPWSAAESQDPVKIAVIAALSGPAGSIGQSQLAGAKVAEMHINEAGGIMGRKIQVIERDTAASPATAVKITQEVAMKENAKFFVGVVSSAVALAIAPVVEQVDGVLVLAAAQTEKSTGSDCNPHVFRITTNSVAVARAAAKLMTERYPNITRWAGINPDYEWGHSAWGVFKPELLKLNPKATIVAELWPKFKATSYETEILKLMEAKPEGIYSSLYASDFITFAKQAKEYKLFDNVKTFMNHAISIEVAKPLGENMVDVWGGGHYHHDAFDNPLNKKFREGHNKLFGNDEPPFAASEAYSALYALKYAVEKAKSFETKPVILALRGLEFDSVTGKRYIRPTDHQAIRAQLFSHFVPTQEAPGWKIVEHTAITSEDVYPRQDEEAYRCKMKW